MTDAYIYDSVRTPRGKGRQEGSLHEVASARLSAGVLNALQQRNGLDGHAVEDVIWGNVTQVMEQGGCLARTAVLASKLHESIPGLSINRFCASGMEAVNLAANQIRGDAGEAYIAGGVEMMSRVPMGSDGAAIAVDPSIAMAHHFVPQGISADIIATEYGFSREDADLLAVKSQKRGATAWAENRFDGSVIAVSDINGLPILTRDEYLRPGTDMQSLGALKPAFKDMGESMPGFDKIALMKYPHLERINHIHHAGNSSGIVDGAAGILIGSKAYGAAHGLKPRAVIRATAKIGTDPTIMLTGPVPVTKKSWWKVECQFPTSTCLKSTRHLPQLFCFSCKLLMLMIAESIRTVDPSPWATLWELRARLLLARCWMSWNAVAKALDLLPFASHPAWEQPLSSNGYKL